MLDRIVIDNFMRIRALDLDVSRPVLLVGGFNESGKSSLAEAIRFALMGDNPRISLKKNFEKMVSDGAKQGKVKLVMGAAELVRNVRDGKAAGGPFPELTAHALEIALGATKFHDLSEAERRAFLSKLIEVPFSADEVRKRLIKRGVAAKMVERVGPLLKQGFESAAAEASRYQSEGRGQWKQITGETYGSVKAETWAAEIPEFDAEREQALAEHVGKLEADCRGLHQRIGACTRSENVSRERKEHIARLKRLVEAFDERQQALEAAASEAESARRSQGKLRGNHDRRLREIDDKLAALRPAVAEAERWADGLACPECGSVLRLENGVLVALEAPGDVEKIRVELVNLEDERAAAAADGKQKLKDADNAVRYRESKEADALEAVHEAEKAQVELETLLHVEQSGSGGEDVEALRAELAGIESALEEAKTEQRVHQNLRAAAESAQERTTAARAVHEQIVGWTQIALAFGPGPDGIPAELLAETLTPVNAELERMASDFGWQAASVVPDMVLTRNQDGRPYYLLSESARWRLDLMFQLVVAVKTGAPLVVVDRVDVLDSAGRGQFLAWAEKHAQALERSVVCMATLKARPNTGRLRNVQVEWVEDGSIQELQENAA